MNFLLNNGISTESFEKFIEFINLHEGKHINIYLEGSGGRVATLEMFLHTINSDHSRFTIIATGYNASANFDLILYSKCEKVITPYCQAAYHLSHCDITTSSNQTPTFEGDKFAIRVNKEINYPRQLAQSKQLGLTSKQMKRLEKSYCIYYTAEEIKELLKQEWEYGI